LTITSTKTADAGSYDCVVSGVTIETSSAASLTVNKLDQTITFDPIVGIKTYGDSSFTVSATGGGSGNPVTFSSDTASTISVSGDTVTILAAGPAIVRGSQAGDSEYNAGSATQSFTVNTKSASVTASNTNKTYGDTVTFAGTEFMTSGFINGDGVSSVTLTSDGASATGSAGAHNIVPSAAVGSGLGNYTINYVNGTLTVDPKAATVTASDESKTYGNVQTPAGTEFTMSGFINGDSVSNVTLTSAGFAASAPTNSYAITPSAATGSGLSNYTISYVDGNLTVGPRGLTVTANDLGKIFGSTLTFAGTEFTTSGLVNGDTVTNATLTSAGATNSAPIGSYPIVISAALGTGLDNYTISYVSGTLSVGSAVMITKNPVGPLVRLPGQSASFSVTATGASLNYQWNKGGNPIGGANATSYTIYPLHTNDTGSYNVTVSNSGTNAESTSATLTVNPDTNAPVAKVLLPKVGVGYSDPQVTGYSLAVNGSATDNARVENVYISNNGGSYTPATLNTNGPVVTWTGSISVTPGSNTFRAYAVDFSSLTSAVSTVTFFYNVTNGLTLNVVKTPATADNVGSVINAAGTNLLVGRSYKLTAVQDGLARYIFTNWTDGGGAVLQSNVLVYTFVMSSNLTINANFITNPFSIYQGTYNGLFYESEGDGGIKHHSAGYVTLKVTPKFGVSGKLTVDGNVSGFSGKFSIDGVYSGIAKRDKYGKTNLTVNLKVNFGAGTVTGSVGNSSPVWTSGLTADHYKWNNTNNPALAYVNNYTLVLPPFDDNTNGPAGYSGALIGVSTNGKVKFTGGTLSDGQKWKAASTLSQSGVWPVYVPLYVQKRTFGGGELKESKGEVIGWLTMQTNVAAGSANLAPLGTVDWINTGGTNTYWTAGYTNQVAVKASRWSPVAPLLNWTTNGLADVSGADLDTNAFSATLSLTTNKLAASLPLTNNFKLGLALAKGFVKGTFDNHTTTALKVPWSGVLLQDWNYGRGYFLGTNGVLGGAGKVEIHVAP